MWQSTVHTCVTVNRAHKKNRSEKHMNTDVFQEDSLAFLRAVKEVAKVSKAWPWVFSSDIIMENFQLRKYVIDELQQDRCYWRISLVYRRRNANRKLTAASEVFPWDGKSHVHLISAASPNACHRDRTHLVADGASQHMSVWQNDFVMEMDYV